MVFVFYLPLGPVDHWHFSHEYSFLFFCLNKPLPTEYVSWLMTIEFLICFSARIRLKSAAADLQRDNNSNSPDSPTPTGASEQKATRAQVNSSVSDCIRPVSMWYPYFLALNYSWPSSYLLSHLTLRDPTWIYITSSFTVINVPRITPV